MCKCCNNGMRCASASVTIMEGDVQVLQCFSVGRSLWVALAVLEGKSERLEHALVAREHACDG